jgi:hypothetical protein
MDQMLEADWQKAVAETNRLQRELDITNADHVALWLEANTIQDQPMSQCASWLACRIVEAHERLLRSPRCLVGGQPAPSRTGDETRS